MESGIVTYVSNRGWFFARCTSDDAGVFIPQKNVENRRYLRLYDRIKFTRIPSAKNSNDLEAIDVKFISHVVSDNVEGAL